MPMTTRVPDTYLVWFSCHRDYFRFRIPELTSLASSFGVDPPKLWVDLPKSPMSNLGEGLQDYIDRGSEASITLGQDEDVFTLVKLPVADRQTFARQIVDRSVLIKGIIEVSESRLSRSSCHSTSLHVRIGVGCGTVT